MAYNEIIKVINNYCLNEFDHDADFSDLENIGLLYTTIGDDENELQVNINIIEKEIYFYIDNVLYNIEKYQDAIELESYYLDFDTLYSMGCDLLED